MLKATNLDATAAAILGELETMTIIDAHEHLPTEAQRLAQPVDALTLFSHYCRGDLAACGMQADAIHFVYSDAPLAERWAAFKPYYHRIANTAYVRAAHIAMEKFYGQCELRDDNIESITAAMRAANQPGLYKKVLRDACRIETCLVNTDPFVEKDAAGLLTPVCRLPWLSWGGSFAQLLEAYGPILSREITSVEDLQEAVRVCVRGIRRHGGVGCKMFVFSMGAPDMKAAKSVFEAARRDVEFAKTLPHANPLTDVLFDTAFDEMRTQGLVAAVHTGYWGDYRKLNPSGVIDMADRHPDLAFDVYHLGYPYMREAILLGKTRGNVHLNMCWTQIISPHFAHEALVEMLEVVPAHKIIGFGGDYFVVEKVYGHLVMAREVIARALSRKIADGWFTVDTAIGIARAMLYENPKTLYKL
ncbi:MAG: amidohydrolase family protein [Phycisphaerae bacterium]|nr:amidohydrolase family protein [Phycisphaerae bacterium]